MKGKPNGWFALLNVEVNCQFIFGPSKIERGTNKVKNALILKEHSTETVR